MKIISKIFLVLILSFGILNLSVNAGLFGDMFGDSQPKVHIDCGEQDCNLTTGTEIVKETVGGIEKERTLTEYVQDITVYILTFISIIAVIYIIYAGFRILTGAGDEEVLKKQKTTILYVVLGMLVIWLAYPIVQFIINVLNSEPTV